MMTRPLVVTLGEALWDVFAGGERVGGAPLNVAWHAAQLGLRARIVSAVGDDERGERIRRALGPVEGSDLQVRADLPTGVVNVQLTDGQPSYEIVRPVAWDAVEWSEGLQERTAEADAVVYGTLAQRDARTRGTLRRLVEGTRRNCLRFFDVNLRQDFWGREVLEWGLRAATFVKLNEDELNVLVQELDLVSDEDVALEDLVREFELDGIALTRGAAGCRLVRRASWENAEARPDPVRVEDAVGAGDAFSAALITGLLAGRPLEEIAAGANAVGGYVASQSGAQPELPDGLRRRCGFDGGA